MPNLEDLERRLRDYAAHTASPKVEADMITCADLIASLRKLEPSAWAIQGSSFVYKGQHAEIDAKAEAMRIKGTCYHYPLYTLEGIL